MRGLPLRHRADPGIQRDLNWGRQGVDLPAGLETRWLGTAGFRLGYEGTTVLFDPYLSCIPRGTVVGRRAVTSHQDLVGCLVPAAGPQAVGGPFRREPCRPPAVLHRPPRRLAALT